MSHMYDRAIERHGILPKHHDIEVLIDQIRNRKAILINGSSRHVFSLRSRDYFMYVAKAKQYIPVIFDFNLNKIVTTLPHHKWLRKQMHQLNKNTLNGNRCAQCDKHFAQFKKEK